MYEAYYGLNVNPFRLAPDPHFFYESGCHKR
ncbi:MAG: ATPase, partial [Pseudomonadota bacterium]|nr:ATPase [Pseudomonadota bacterium]